MRWCSYFFPEKPETKNKEEKHWCEGASLESKVKGGLRDLLKELLLEMRRSRKTQQEYPWWTKRQLPSHLVGSESSGVLGIRAKAQAVVYSLIRLICL